jgi:hypothetical protein
MLGGVLMGLGIGGNVLGGLMGADAQREAGEYNRNLMRQRAEMTEQAMQRETEIATERGRILKASQYAAYAKSGAMPSSGTPLLVQIEQAGKIQRDINEARRNRMIEASGLRHQGDVALAQAKAGERAQLLGTVGSTFGMVAPMIPTGSPKTLLNKGSKKEAMSLLGDMGSYQPTGSRIPTFM